MKIIQQAERQWLDYLYSKSPYNKVEHLLLRLYYWHKRHLLSLTRGCAELGATQITSTEDYYGSPLWHAYDPVTNIDISTYSKQELERWFRR